MKTEFTKEEDKFIDNNLRPNKFSDFIGQEKIKKNLKILLEAAKNRKEPAEHILLHGAAGLGKTTLAHIIANEVNTGFKITSGPALEKVGDLAAILSNLSDGDILFIDEIHRLNNAVEEILYPAMEDYYIDIVLGKGPSAKTLQLPLPKFTLIGATTRMSLLSGPFRSRFGAIYHLDFYSEDDIGQIIKRSASILNISIESDAVTILAKASRQTPRLANRLLKRARDLAQIKAKKIINSEIAKSTLKMLEIDDMGLEKTDLKILEFLITKFNGGPVGLKTLAAICNEEENTLEEIYEPYLLQLGFLNRTSKGRIATPSAYQYLKKIGVIKDLI